MISHPLLRPLLALLLLGLIMNALRAQWSQRTSSRKVVPNDQVVLEDGSRMGDKLVVAHFMLGNTYPFTEDDWRQTFALAQDTLLDGFALNLGPEDWQLRQAHSAFKVLSESQFNLKLFLSLDMNVQPSTTTQDGDALLEKVVSLMSYSGYMRKDGELLLSTFGGHSASFGEAGWAHWLNQLNRRVGQKVFFMPAFFMPPDDFMKLPYVDGCYAWNNAWPMGNDSTNLKEDEPFLQSSKPYMAAISPLFSTHYGTEGQWAFNKNWIYRSDDLLFPTRFAQLINLQPRLQPDILQIISWNDYGESHAIAPVIGAQPGSEAWTDGMPHEAFRQMAKWFIGEWKRGQRLDFGSMDAEDEVRVWGWWRTHPSSAFALEDSVGRPDHAEWAQDLLNFVIILPSWVQEAVVVLNNPQSLRRTLGRGMNTLTTPFVPGQVAFELRVPTKQPDGTATEVTLLRGTGREIEAEPKAFNFNMWSGSWQLVSRP